jgi:hypothetical protein
MILQRKIINYLKNTSGITYLKKRKIDSKKNASSSLLNCFLNLEKPVVRCKARHNCPAARK